MIGRMGGSITRKWVKLSTIYCQKMISMQISNGEAKRKSVRNICRLNTR